MKPPCYLTPTERFTPPCFNDSELWWGPDLDDTDLRSSTSANVAEYDERATNARVICATECPLHQQQKCARAALDAQAYSGVWAGVKLPYGGSNNKYRHARLLNECRRELQMIADGEMAAHEQEETARLLEQQQIVIRCPQCRQTKPQYAFHLDDENRVVGWCKKCRREHKHDERIAKQLAS